MNTRLSFRNLWSHPFTRAYLLATVAQRIAAGWYSTTYVLFLRSYGLSFAVINLINMVFMFVWLILNPKAGRIADQYGQKRVYLWGLGIFSFGTLVYGLSHNVAGFLLAETFSGIGNALMADALESWLRNVSSKKQSDYTISVGGAVNTLAIIPTSLLGSAIGSLFGLSWPWLLSALTGGLAVLYSWHVLHRLPEKDLRFTGEHRDPPSVWEVIKLTWQVKPLRFSGVIALAIGAATAPFNMLWAPILQEVSGSTWWFGSLWIGIAVFSAFGSWWARHKKQDGLAAMLLITGLPMCLPIFIPTTAGVVIPFLIHEIGRGAFRPLLFNFSNVHIESHYRTTANSIRGSIWTLGMVIGLCSSALLSLIISPLAIWLVAGIGLVLASVYAKKGE